MTINRKGNAAPPRRGMLESNGVLSHDWWRWLVRLRDGIPAINSYTVEVDIPAVAAGAHAQVTITVGGVETDDVVWGVPPPTRIDIVVVGCHVTTPDTVLMTVLNPTGGTLNPAAEDYRFLTISL